jgi:hypothetical protein
MTTATQIIGNIQPGNQALDMLVGVLGQLGVRAAHPSADGFFTISSEHPAWHHYDTELELYESIAKSPFHILFNDGAITDTAGQQLLYAMLKNRPIIMSGTPTFSDTISPFARDTIMTHLHRFHAVHLPGLDATEMKALLSHLKPCDYALTNSEKVLIQSRVRAHFRRLLEEARDIYVER